MNKNDEQFLARVRAEMRATKQKHLAKAVARHWIENNGNITAMDKQKDVPSKWRMKKPKAEKARQLFKDSTPVSKQPRQTRKLWKQ